MDINDIYGIIDKFDGWMRNESDLEMNGVCAGSEENNAKPYVMCL